MQQLQRGGPGSDPGAPGYPWPLEREALEALERLEIDRCRTALRQLAADIPSKDGPPPTVAALLLNDLLARLAGTLEPGEPRAGAARLRRAERLGSAAGIVEVRRAFLQEAEVLFAPLSEGGGICAAVMRARTYLDNHFTNRVSLQELADAVGLSPNYISSLFRRETGMTITQYLRQRRMCLAEKLLRADRQSISEIATRVGYQNYRDFHRNFVRAGGRSPRAFRRLCHEHLDA